MALDGIDRFDHGIGRCQITETPTGHRVGFTEAVDRNCQIVRCLGERCDAHVFRVVVDELLVNFIR